MTATGARALAVCAALLFSTGGAVLKDDAFNAAQMSALRSGIAAIALVVWMRGRVALSPRIVATGALYAATVTLFVTATKWTTAASAIFLQSASPLYVAVLAPRLFGERITLRDIGSLAVIATGLGLCFAGRPEATQMALNPAAGNVLAAVCGLTWALTLLSLRQMEQFRAEPGTGLAAVVTGNALACIVALPFAWPFTTASPAAWAGVVYLGTAQIGAAYICLTSAVRQLPAFEVSLLLLIEPVLNPIWTWLVRGEHPGSGVIAGGALILAGTAVRIRRTASASPVVPPSA